MKKVWKKSTTGMLSLTVVALLAACGNEAASTEDGEEAVTLHILHNWNGSSATAPEDTINNAVADKIFEETGVRLEYTFASSSEVETLTNVLSTGDYPDVYVGPAWGGESELMLDAASQGLLYDLTPYIEEHPNLEEVVQEENMSAAFFENIFSKQEGGQFFLHSQYPATEEDIVDWLYLTYVNKDFADEVGIDPASVRTPDDLYNFLKAIQDANLEVNGNNVFPMGGYDNGWPMDITSEMFVPVAGWGSWFIEEDGTARFNFMTEEYEEWILFIRKLMSEGLIDPEIYTHTGTIAREKVAQGRYAVLPNQFPGLWNDTKSGGLNEKYVPLGPLEDFEGNPYRTVFNVQGSELIAVFENAGEEKLEAFIRLFDYLSSDEGFILTNYGIEGEHYDIVEGEIVAKEEMVEKMQDNTLKDEGVNTVYQTLSGLDRTQSLGGGEFGYQYDAHWERRYEIQDMVRQEGIDEVEGSDPNTVYRDHENFAQIEPVTLTIGDVVQQAVMATTEEEAVRIIEETRNALINAGIEEVEEEITRQAQDGKEFMLYRTSN